MSSAETQFPMPDRGKCVLIVVDMQNGFIMPNGSCARIGLPVQRLEAAIDPTRQAVALARTYKVPIIWTRYTFKADFSDGGFMVREKIPGLASEKALVAGSWDQQIIDSLIPHPNDLVLDKNRPSSFHDTGLQETLRQMGIADVVVCGVTTNCCVETTIRDASQRDYRSFVLRDAVAEYDESRHREALNSMDALFAHLISIPQLEVAWKEPIR